MKALEFVAEVDEHHRLELELPASAAPGRVRVIVLLPEPGDDEAGAFWTQGIAREWAAELADKREDIYTMEDGEPVEAAG